MRYMGGKFRQSKKIVEHCINDYCGGAYYEPFVGAFGVAEKVVPALATKGCTKFVLGDKSIPVMTMWNAVLYDGWEPPSWVSEDEYAEYSIHRRGHVDDPMFAWCGYGLSFGGKWFGGFARGGAKGQSSEKMQLNQKKALLRKRDAVLPYAKLIETYVGSYHELEIENGSLLYCDPPYAGRTKAHHTAGGFDSNAFWAWCRDNAAVNRVLATEFTTPENVTVLHNWGDTVVRHNNGKKSDGTQELLVRVNP